MTKIEKLTPEQEKLKEEYCKRWLNTGLCSDPVDFAVVETHITKLYELNGFKKPEFLRVASPIQAEIALNLLKDDGDLDTIESRLKVAYDDWKAGKQRKYTSIGTWFWGSWDSFWVALYLFAREIGVAFTEEQNNKLNEFAAITQNSGWWYPYPDLCVICDRPQVHRDAQGRLHNENGPALSFRDEYGVYAIHAVRVAPYVIMNPEKITVQDIESEKNVEVRRVKLDRYPAGGAKGFLMDSGAKEVARDEWGILYEKKVPGDEPIMVVVVENSTPEPDGTFKNYHHRVNPNVKTPKEAVASMWQMSEDQYNPIQES